MIDTGLGHHRTSKNGACSPIQTPVQHHPAVGHEPFSRILHVPCHARILRSLPLTCCVASQHIDRGAAPMVARD